MKILPIILFILLPISLLAQRPYYRPNVHEVDLQLAAGHWLPGDATLKNHKSLGISPLNGLRYRYHFNKNSALRVGVFYRAQSFLLTDKSETGGSTLYNLRSLEGKIGYERKIDFRKYQLYGGIDAIIGQRNFIQKTQNTEISTPQFGAGGFVGIRRYMSENWSFAIENEFHFLQNSNEKSLISAETGANFLQIMVSYHFKRMHKSCACGKPGS